MKEKGTIHWKKPNTGATNSCGFKGLPGGIRNVNGPFRNISDSSNWQSVIDNSTSGAWFCCPDYFFRKYTQERRR